MAAIPCKVIAQVAFKAGGDVFHHLLVNRPHHLAKASPRIQGVHLHQGSHGTNGSIIEWKYIVDGKEQIGKDVIENADEEKKQITYRMIEGDAMKLYKNLLMTAHVETKEGIDFITWTVDYELLNPNNPHPLSLLDYLIRLTTDMETHIFG